MLGFGNAILNRIGCWYGDRMMHSLLFCFLTPVHIQIYFSLCSCFGATMPAINVLSKTLMAGMCLCHGAGVQKNFTSCPVTSLSSRLARRLVPRRSHWLVSHFSPKTSLTMV